ncbi:hypothetical protein GE09DRAFT_1087737 [Coniochaeta sp. 2T2.1]|nr:hypothetical protein GE09DRAFT_1087737 [Coniochaeta sp. 2T2.1]
MEGGIVQKWSLLIFQKEPLEGMKSEGVRDIFREFLKADREIALGLLAEKNAPDVTVPDGVDADLCFMIDEGVVSSLLDQHPGKRPYIIGILSDLNLDFDEDEDDDDEEETPDDDELVQFKIALDSVVDLWRQCWVQDVKELVPPVGKIYISPGVWEDDD